MRRPAKSGARGGTTPIPASTSTCCRASTSFRSSRTTTGRASTRPAPEIQAYIKKVADDRRLRRYIRFNEEIVEARFIDGRWHVKTAKRRDRCRGRVRCRDRLPEPADLSRHRRARQLRRTRLPFRALGPQRAARGQALGHHRLRLQRHPDHRGAGLGGCRCHPVHPPGAVDSYPREPGSELAAPHVAEAALRLPAGAARSCGD